jgi:hypothetical protein
LRVGRWGHARVDSCPRLIPGLLFSLMYALALFKFLYFLWSSVTDYSAYLGNSGLIFLEPSWLRLWNL